MKSRRFSVSRTLIVLWTAAIVVFLYIPIVSVVVASFSHKRYFSFPVTKWTTKCIPKCDHGTHPKASL